MLGQNNAAAHNRRSWGSAGHVINRRGNRNTASPIGRPNWLSVDQQMYCHPTRTLMWEPCTQVRCPCCNIPYPLGSKHFTGDERQGCRQINAIEKIQHGLLLCHQRLGLPKIYLSVNTIEELKSHGLQLEHVFMQEPNWLPNEDMFGWMPDGSWGNTGFNIVDEFLNISPVSQEGPEGQDNCLEVDNEYLRNGPITYAPYMIRRRKEKKKQEVYGEVLPVLVNLAQGHVDASIQNESYRTQIGNAKAAIQALVNNGTMNQANANSILNCFPTNLQDPGTFVPPPPIGAVPNPFHLQVPGAPPATQATNAAANYIAKILTHYQNYP